MGRRRASRRSGIQKLRRIDLDRAKGMKAFEDGLASRGDIQDGLKIYHELYIEPLMEFLNIRLSPWYKRIWWWAQDLWDSWRSDNMTEQDKLTEPDKVSDT